MLWIFVKNDLKRFFRDKLGAVMLIGFPILLIFILSSAFSTMMNEKFVLEPFSVGYSITENSPLFSSIATISDDLKKEKITLTKMERNSAFSDITNGKLAGFVEFNDSSYVFYKSDQLTISASIFDSYLSSIAYTTDTYSGMHKYFAENGINPTNKQNSTPDTKSLVEFKQLKVEPVPSSLEYYSIAMLINVLTFAILSAAAVINDDRKRNMNLRIFLTKANPLTIFVGRIISSVVTSMVQVTVAIIATMIFLRVSFGSHYIQVILLILLFSITTSTLGVAIGYFFKNISIARTIVYILSWFLNFFGGSYTPYIYAGDDLLGLMKKTPLYYIIRSAIEVVTKGYSDLIPTAITIEISVIVVSLIIGVLFYTKREAKLCNE